VHTARSSVPDAAISSMSTQSFGRSNIALNTARSSGARIRIELPAKGTVRRRVATSRWNGDAAKNTSIGVSSHHRRT